MNAWRKQKFTGSMAIDEPSYPRTERWEIVGYRVVPS